MINDSILWAAGFFDGEGCTSLTKNSSASSYVYANITISQVELEPITRFMNAVEKRGAIFGPYEHGEWQPIHKYQCRKIADVLWIYNNLGPHLCLPKREQMRAAIEASSESRKTLGRNPVLVGQPNTCQRGHDSAHRTTHGQCRMCMRISDAKRRGHIDPAWLAGWEAEGGVRYTGWLSAINLPQGRIVR